MVTTLRATFFSASALYLHVKILFFGGPLKSQISNHLQSNFANYSISFVKKYLLHID